MKIIHIDSGLGNQMLSYCEYLAMKMMNPDDDCFIETIVYDIPECQEVVCQWNGYELNRIFGINAPNIKSLFTPTQWESIINEVRASKFWEKNWNYPVYITQALNHAGIEVKNVRGNFEAKGYKSMGNTVQGFKQNKIYAQLSYLKNKVFNKETSFPDLTNILFRHSEKSVFIGQLLYFKFKNSGIERIEKEIRESFRFPPITDQQNLQMWRQINDGNSVGIHVRRGDMLPMNYQHFADGYFRRATRYIKQHVSQPEFFIFCDQDTTEWSKTHIKELGLDQQKDTITFVDWNKGLDSWRDMQLMAACKHQIITRSSFGWWGSWLNTFPDKITISPIPSMNTTVSL